MRLKFLTVIISLLLILSASVYADETTVTETSPAATNEETTERVFVGTEPGDIILTEPMEKPDTKTWEDWEYYHNEDDKISIYKYLGMEETVTMPEEIDNLPVNHVFNYAFEDDYMIKELNLPSSLESFEAFAFYNLHEIQNITIADTNEMFMTENGILYTKDQTALIQYPVGRRDYSFTVPETVEIIGPGAFATCRYLEEVILPDKLTAIYDYAFAECFSLSTLDIPKTVTLITSYAFVSCSSLRRITLPDGIIAIYEGTFGKCAAITEFTVPASVKEIGYGAFYDCANLEKISFADNNSMENILDYAFGNCKKLLEVKLMGNAEIGERAFGYVFNDYGESAKISDFTLTGQPGSNLENYAKAAGITYDQTGESIITQPILTIPAYDPELTTPVTDPNSGKRGIFWTVMAVGGVLVLVIAVAVTLGIKKNKKTVFVDNPKEEIEEDIKDEAVDELKAETDKE